jgi:RNA polymerase sigma-B factor
MIPCSTTNLTGCDTVALLETARTAAPTERSLAEDELVHRYLPMTRRMANRFIGRGADAEDLRQVANLALVKAMRGFHADRGCFEAYAKASISGALKRHLRDQGWAVRPPRRVQELQAQISQSTAELVQQDGTLPAPTTLALYMDANVTDITEALTARNCYAAASLDQPIGQAGRSLADSLTTEEDPYDEVVGRLTMVQLCAELPAGERELLRLRFYECLSQREIAAEIGVSQMQVSRLLTGLMGRLRQRSVDARVA